MTRVYTGGTFDLFHTGHVNLLRRCAELGEVVVALNTDDFIERFKGHRPVIAYDDRATVLRACRYVSDVVPNVGGEDSKPVILSVEPDIVAVGDDWAPPRDYFAQMRFTQAWLDEHAIRLVYLPRTPFISSSDIRGRMDGLRGPAGRVAPRRGRPPVLTRP